MANIGTYTNVETFLKDIADAIRLKNGDTNNIPAFQFPEIIANLETNNSNPMRIIVGNAFSQDGYYKENNTLFSYCPDIPYTRVEKNGIITLDDGSTIDNYCLNIGYSLDKAKFFFIPGVYSPSDSSINTVEEINPDRINAAGISIYGIKNQNDNWIIYSSIIETKINCFQTENNLLIMSSTNGEILNSDYTITNSNLSILNGLIPIPLFTITNNLTYNTENIIYQSSLYNDGVKAFLPDIYIIENDEIINTEDFDNENSALIGTGEIV